MNSEVERSDVGCEWKVMLRLFALSLRRVQLCDSMDCSPPGSSVHGSFQARILEWIAMPSSRGSSQPRDRTRVSCVCWNSLTLVPPKIPHNC